MNHLEKNNPVALRAELRRKCWEAEQAMKRGFWTRKRFDLIDLLTITGGVSSLIIGLYGLIELAR